MNVKNDISLWDNPRRMRTTIKNLATMILVLVAFNGWTLVQEKHWVILAINIIYALIVLPVFISKARYDKNPPKEEGDIKK